MGINEGRKRADREKLIYLTELCEEKRKAENKIIMEINRNSLEIEAAVRSVLGEVVFSSQVHRDLTSALRKSLQDEIF